MTDLTIEESEFRAAFEAALLQPPRLPDDHRDWRPRGIIIPAGGARMYTCAWIAVRMLREVAKTRLPIQVWHLGHEEMSPAMAALLAEQDVEVVDALDIAGEPNGARLGGFELKSFALLNCAFREVLLLDADNVPLIDPEEIFEHDSFRSTGAVFWPDIVSILPSSRIWELCNVQYRSMPSFESGQLAVDRQRCHAALALSWLLNRHSNLVYRHIYGDKDTFLIAWLALGQPYHLIPHPARRLVATMCQHHPDGRRMFQHRNLQKWKLHGFNPRIEHFAEEDSCFRFLAELRSRWTGRILLPSPYDAEMRRIERDLIAARRFKLETVSIGSEAIELHPHNLVRNVGDRPLSWWLTRENGTVMLMLGEDEVINRRFICHSQNYWRSSAPETEDQDMVLLHVPGLPMLPAKGHNSDTIVRSFDDWPRNYRRIEGKEHGGQ